MEVKTLRDRTLRALNDVQLEILQELDRICRKHDIKYSLGGGSCLGQYRHGGIIPWDDDIDIDMIEENYDKFIEVAQKEIDHEKFFLRCRETDSLHFKTACRLERKGTKLATVSMMARKDAEDGTYHPGIFVDIFRFCYLPNDETERRRIASRLFLLRKIEDSFPSGKMHATDVDPKYHEEFVRLLDTVPPEEIIREEMELAHTCKGERTDWIIDDATVNGDHGGFPSNGIDEYEDVMFDGIKVMNKKNSVNFLTTLYGEHFAEWLPPMKRVSHHMWAEFDLGEYAKKAGLPENYAYCMTRNYDAVKLKRMQEVSVDMYVKVAEICDKYGLKYYVMGLDDYALAQGADEFTTFWKGQGTIAMPYADYVKFMEVAQDELQPKFFLQNQAREEGFHDSCCRVCLEFSEIGESNVPSRRRGLWSAAFYIRIVPLFNTSNFEFQRKKHYEDLKDINKRLSLKWRKGDDLTYFRADDELKEKLDRVRPYSFEQLEKEFDEIRNRYSDKNTNWYIDGTGGYLNEKYLSKATLGEGQIRELLGKKLNFPASLSAYCAELDAIATKGNQKVYSEIQDIARLQNGDPVKLREAMEKQIAKYCEKAPKKFRTCHLGYFEAPEYQLSAWRYDEKEDRYLSVKEILGYE